MEFWLLNIGSCYNNNLGTEFHTFNCVVYIEGGSSGLESQQSIGGDIESGISSAAQPRLHRQKLPNKPNRGKTFRSFKSKTSANIEVPLFLTRFNLTEILTTWNVWLCRYRILRWNKNWWPFHQRLKPPPRRIRILSNSCWYPAEAAVQLAEWDRGLWGRLGAACKVP